jgi:hypothetical protein
MMEWVDIGEQTEEQVRLRFLQDETNKVVLVTGERFDLPRNRVHRVRSMAAETSILEVSTFSEDSDSYRIIPST